MFCREVKWSESRFPACLKSSSSQRHGFIFLSCAELQRILLMNAHPEPQSTVNVVHTDHVCHKPSHFLCFIQSFCMAWLIISVLLAQMWCRYVGPSSRLSALDLSNDRSAVHAFCLPQSPLQSPEEHQALCQHGCQKHVYQWPSARSWWELKLLGFLP